MKNAKKFKTKEKNAHLTAEEAGKKAKKQMMAVLMVGAVLMIADIVVSSSKEAVQVVESDGHLYMIRPDAGEEASYLSLRADISGGSVDVEEKVSVMLEPYGQEKTGDDESTEDETPGEAEESERMGYEIRNMISGFNKDISQKRIELPAALDTGEKISWTVEDDERSNVFVISMLTMVIAFCIYKNRFAGIERRRREERESVIRQLPEFVNRLVLLLNAGLVLTSAFERSVEESFGFDEGNDDYFYGKLKEIYITSKTANGSMNVELRRLAKESGIRELMRVSNIINDNINKCVELTHKLQAESELLWLSRKKSCEEKGRLAETKLTLPLMIFLMVLITITIAPALLEL